MTFSSKQLRLLHQNRKRDQVSRFVAGDCFEVVKSVRRMVAPGRHRVLPLPIALPKTCRSR